MCLPTLRAVLAAMIGCALASGIGPAFAAERICQSPDCLLVENVHSEKGRVESTGVLDTRLHLYIYVPSATAQFTLGIFDQADDAPDACAKPSRFVLTAPNSSGTRTLNIPPGKSGKGWSEYAVGTGGKTGIWRLTVTGPEDRDEKDAAKARNTFRVRTTGQVDLYLKLEAVARVRGLRLHAPRFGGGWNSHRFAVAIPGGDRLRLNLLHPQSWGTEAVTLAPPPGNRSSSRQSVASLTRDDRLPKNVAFSTRDVMGMPALPAGLWPLIVRPATTGAEDVYGFGIDGGAADGAVRVFFPATDGSAPLLALPVAAPIMVSDHRAARLTVSPDGAEMPQTLDTDARGQATAFLLPGGRYPLTVTRGPDYRTVHANLTPGRTETISAPVRLVPSLPGWLAGDPHCHTTYYDGTDTPTQMVSAARAAGLDWVVVSEHGHGPSIDRVERANREAAAAGAGLRVIPGMEFTTGTYHANIFGGFVRLPNNSGLDEVLVAAANEEKRVGAPVVVTLNHPSLGKTASDIARTTAKKGSLPLLELWNSAEPAATRLWWDLLNSGQRIFAETGSDSHNRVNAPLGRRRTYVYLGASAGRADSEAVLRALRAGHSFLSQGGATLDFTLTDARPGDTLPVKKGINMTLRARIHAAMPLERLDIIYNGAVIRSQAVRGTTADLSFTLPASPGWYLAQLWAKNNRKEPVALCNPVFVRTIKELP